MTTANYSIYSIPAYWAITLMPHLYAFNIINKANNYNWDNSSPRSVVAISNYKKSVPAAVFATYERCKGAHANGYENFGMFIGAILAGNMAKLDSNTLNNAAATMLVLRLAYNWAYISITSNRLSYIRSVLYNLFAALMIRIYILAGNRFVSEY